MCEHDLRISQPFFGALLLGAGSAILGQSLVEGGPDVSGGFDPDAVMIGTIPEGCEVLARVRPDHSSL